MKFFQSRRRIAIALAVVALLAIVSFYAWSYVAAGGISIQITPADIVIGESFDLKVSFMNDSGNSLSSSSLDLELPDGLVAVNEADNKKILNKDTGAIAESGFHQETFRIMAVPTDNHKLVVTATMTYVPRAISARFKKSESYELDVTPLKADLNLVVPATVFSGEQFEITGDYKGGNAGSAEKLSLKVIYPSQFSKTSEQITEVTDVSES